MHLASMPLSVCCIANCSMAVNEQEDRILPYIVSKSLCVSKDVERFLH